MTNSYSNATPEQLCPRLTQGFYQRDTQVVASGLLGKILFSSIGATVTSGRIVETEAYLSERDSACHASKHRTSRTQVMFGPAGVAYVYPIHAKHCFNIVTEDLDQGCAVLIRALEPLQGIEKMQRRRGLREIRRLTTGPACICQAMGIDRQFNGTDLTRLASPIWLEDDGTEFSKQETINTIRIGVTSAQHRKLRFAVRGNSFVSGPSRMR
jgi:DNA-3-methyladenine glycosylase